MFNDFCSPHSRAASAVVVAGPSGADAWAKSQAIGGDVVSRSRAGGQVQMHIQTCNVHDVELIQLVTCFISFFRTRRPLAAAESAERPTSAPRKSVLGVLEHLQPLVGGARERPRAQVSWRAGPFTAVTVTSRLRLRAAAAVLAAALTHEGARACRCCHGSTATQNR